MRRPAAALAPLIVLCSIAFGPGAVADTPSPSEPSDQSVVADAAFPTNMAFAPDGRLFYTEKETGNIRIVQGGKLLDRPFAKLPVQGGGESGLLGLALDPNFEQTPFVYVYFTSSQDGRNHIARIPASSSDPDVGGPPENLLTLLTASGIHNGGDLVFGQDGKLYAVVGETGNEAFAQDPASLGGKILRMNPDGSIPSDNPFGPDSYVYSLGHRNSFGLCVNPHNGDLWETENGPSSDDEVNLIEAGKNYGWPDQLGPAGKPGFVDPKLTFPSIIVPTGCVFDDHAISATSVRPKPGQQLVFGDFHGDLHSVVLQPPAFDDVQRVTTEAHFPDGITDLKVGPDGDLYAATSSSIVRIPPGEGVPFSPAAGPSPPVTGGSGSGGGSGGPGLLTIVAIVAALVLLVVGALVLVSRRRKRRNGAGGKNPPFDAVPQAGPGDAPPEA
ncbi:MAG TPA: PQQ-dependent sugar dehydrogenase [Actinomycetota bacterium]|nr:PQQ-dependent sugar dehydrogenase [Actinomycetota bacterium]